MHNKFKNLPEGYQLIETDDGSYTFYSSLFDENCHSTSGAVSETKKYFIEDSHLNDLKNGATIFEVGFGLGIGLDQVMNYATSVKKPLKFYSCEIDPKLVEWYFQNSNLEISKQQDLIQAKTDYLEITIFIGDILENFHHFSREDHQIKFDRIFQDAFSPKKNPTLWTEDWFSKLYKHANPRCILTTYSASQSVIENLKASGFQVEKIEGFGKKRAATRAIKK